MNKQFSGRKKKRRKPSPQPSRTHWWDVDGCWFCQNRSNCNNCKVLKEAVINQKKKGKDDWKKNWRKEYE